MAIGLANVKKIAVFRLGGLGDYLLILPFFEDLRSLFPQAEITAIVAPTGLEILKQQAAIDHYVVSKQLYLPNANNPLTFAYFVDFLNMKKELKPPYDLFIDLTNKYSRWGWFKPYLFYRACNPRHGIGFDFKGRGKFLDIKIPDERYRQEHHIARCARVLQALGGKSEFRLGRIQIPSSALNQAEAFYQSFSRQPQEKRIGIHPGANPWDFQARAWPVERFADLADRIAANENAQFFMTGSKGEDGLYERLVKLSRAKIHRIPACSSVLEICAYLKGLDYYVTNDTGPMHLAVCVGVPTVGIFGRSDFASYGTYPSSVPFTGITLESGNESHDRRDPRGLKKICVEEVFTGFLELKKRFAGQAR